VTVSDDNPLGRRVLELIEFYVAHGCPCRFPRFRAFCARDLAEVGVCGAASSEQTALIFAFDEKVPVREKKSFGPTWRGRCGRCGSEIKRWAHELVMSSWVEYLQIELSPGITDIGAPVVGPLVRCRPAYAAGPGVTAAALREVDAAYPLVSEDAWIEWLRALRAT
jgi:hypothetical protein